VEVAFGDSDAVVAANGDGNIASNRTLFAAAQRSDDLLYLHYDNEICTENDTLYPESMTSCAGIGAIRSGEKEACMGMCAAMEANGALYAASTSVIHPQDVFDKAVWAREISGLRYIHLNVPCSKHWGVDPKTWWR